MGGVRHVSPPRHMTHASVTHATTSYRWQTTRRSPFSHPSLCWRTEGPVEWWGHRKRIPAPNWTPSHILRGEERQTTVRHVITQCYALYFEGILKRVFCWFCISWWTVFVWLHLRLYTTFSIYAVALPTPVDRFWCIKLVEFSFRNMFFSWTLLLTARKTIFCVLCFRCNAPHGSDF